MGVEGFEYLGRCAILPIDALARRRRGDGKKTGASKPKAKRPAREEPGKRRGRRTPELERLLAHGRREVAALPDVRREKVIEARLRISSGHYNHPDVRVEIVRALLRDVSEGRSSRREPEPRRSRQKTSAKASRDAAGKTALASPCEPSRAATGVTPSPEKPSRAAAGKAPSPGKPSRAAAGKTQRTRKALRSEPEAPRRRSIKTKARRDDSSS